MNTIPECVWDARAALGEGPVWSAREQALYWVDILGRQLHQYRPAGDERHSWSFDEEISSVAERRETDGLIATLRYGFAFFDLATSALERLVEPESHLPGNRFNDGKCDREGRYWAGSVEFGCREPVGSLYRLTPDLHCERMDTGYAVTNGPTWSADWKTMYFNDSHLGHVYAFDFDPGAGTIANKRLFLEFGAEDGSPDGMTTDAEGCLWIAHWGPGKVTRRDPQGRLMRTIALPCSHVTSCAFGGSDLKTLYITSARVGLDENRLAQQPLAGSLFAIDLDVAGVPANRFAG
ncbi:MAG TPA: SMP-30/gluconolactonase/LRE family protein [Paucimonas sp.]|nr:SMP-30/gluconolactonase/LRE family protein [Paucimonas sp.]